MTTSAREWRAAREEDIRRAYADKECWNDLDRITCQHPYNFNAIEQWPLYAAVICKPTDRASVLLGSIKAACSLEDIFKTLSVKVTVAVTMCANEMEIRGAPKDWAQYFQQEKVFHIKCHLDDTTLKPPHRWEERIPDLVASCLEQWKIVCGQLWKQSMLAVTRGESMHVLFHCFEGINRSAGALCGSSWVTTTLQRMPSSCCLRKDLPCALGTIAPMSWRLCGSWKVCVPCGTWNWVRRAEINLHHCSSGETVRGEPAKSVANCCLFVQLESVDLHVFVWSNSMTDDLTLVRANNYMHDRAIWNFRGGSCASLVPAWVFDGCFSRMRSKGSRFTLGVWGLRVCSLDVAFVVATVRNRSQPFATVRAIPVWPLPMGSFTEVVLFGGFRRVVASFRVAGVALRDIQTCSGTCRKSFCVAGAILLLHFRKMCCSFRGRCSTLDVSIVIFRGRRGTWDVSCCVFFANRIGRAASSGDN